MLLYKEGVETRDLYRVKNNAVIEMNAVTFKLITGKTTRGRVERYVVVGCYIPPLDTTGTTQ